jgi:hypothetical protein
MIRKKQQQSAGNDSTNIQIAGDAHIGVSFSDARQISLDVFKANFYELSENAAKKALERVSELTEDFLTRFFEDEKNKKEKLEDPGVQASIFEVQKAYAKTGDKTLEQRLLDTLIERTKADERSLIQIALDEAITILPRLTDAQVSILSLVLSATKVRYSDIRNVDAFEAFINEALVPFVPDSITAAELNHLQSCGCYTLPTGGPLAYLSFGEYLGARYKGLLTNGFTEERFTEETNGMRILDFGAFLIPNARYPDLLQFNAMYDQEFDNIINQMNLGPRGELLKALWTKTAMNKLEVEAILGEINPKVKVLIHLWNKSILPAMQITPAGYAIATINLNRVMNAKLDFWAFM